MNKQIMHQQVGWENTFPLLLQQFLLEACNTDIFLPSFPLWHQQEDKNQIPTIPFSGRMQNSNVTQAEGSPESGCDWHSVRKLQIE